MFFSTFEYENPELYKMGGGGGGGLQCCKSSPGKNCNERGKSVMLQGEGLQCCRSSGGRSAMLQIFRGKVCNVADLPRGRSAKGKVCNTTPALGILCKWTHPDINIIPGDKGRDLTQFYDKKTLTPINIRKANMQHKNATKNFDYITIVNRVRIVSWSNDIHPTGVVINRFTWSRPSQ